MSIKNNNGLEPQGVNIMDEWIKKLTLTDVVVTYCQCIELSNINDSLIGEEICVKCNKPIKRKY